MGLTLGVGGPLVAKFLYLLKTFLYHTGVLPYGDFVYGLVTTSIAGGVSLALGPVLFTLLWRVKDEGGKAEEKTCSHDRRTRFFLVWLSFLVIYSLLLSVWQDNALSAGLENLFVGYVFSVLMVVSAFVLMIAMRGFLVNIPLLFAFKKDWDYYFALYCVTFWSLLIVKAAGFGPVFRHT